MELYLRSKIGIVWDACTAHNKDIVLAFIEEHEDRLCAAGINGGLTSVLQVADLVGNKDLKAMIKDRYYVWRTKYIHAKS